MSSRERAQLRVVLDDALTTHDHARVARDIVRSLIATRPDGVDVVGSVAASPESDYARLTNEFPELHHVHKSVFERRERALAWRCGIELGPRAGRTHATSLDAPLTRTNAYDAYARSVVVTVPNSTAWTHPELLPARHVRTLTRAMNRAARHADAIIAPSHPIAAVIADRWNVGDRLIVVPPAPVAQRPRPFAPASVTSDTPYVVAVGAITRASATDALIAAVCTLIDPIRLVIASPDPRDRERVERWAGAHGAAAARIHVVTCEPEDASALIAGARALVRPHHADGFASSILDAFALGTPVLHRATPEHVDLAAGAGLTLEAGEADPIAGALDTLLADDELARRLSTLGRDRARAFDGEASGRLLWEIHASV